MGKSKFDIFISLGSNIEPEHHIKDAVVRLRESCGPIICSSFYRSPPVGFSGPDFINCVVQGKSGLSPVSLRAWLKECERSAGRRHSNKLESRELDLDLLLYGDQIIELGDLVIPRPGMLDCAYVLGPLAEIAPELTHPVTGCTFAFHWRGLSEKLDCNTMIEPIESAICTR